jgi:hypothetical protein
MRRATLIIEVVKLIEFRFTVHSAVVFIDGALHLVF